MVGGGGAKGMGGGRGPSLPALLLVVLSQSLRVAAHLCEALGAGARAPARPTLLGWLDLCQNVPDLSLSQLEVQRGRQRLVCEYRTSADKRGGPARASTKIGTRSLRGLRKQCFRFGRLPLEAEDQEEAKLVVALYKGASSTMPKMCFMDQKGNEGSISRQY